MKAMPHKKEGHGSVPCTPEEATHIYFQFKNEDSPRCLPVQIKGTREGTKNWSWNGDVDRPTVKPSIACRPSGQYKCHVWLNDGCVQHLSDCTCGFRGETHELEDLDPKEWT